MIDQILKDLGFTKNMEQRRLRQEPVGKLAKDGASKEKEMEVYLKAVAYGKQEGIPYTTMTHNLLCYFGTVKGKDMHSYYKNVHSDLPPRLALPLPPLSPTPWIQLPATKLFCGDIPLKLYLSILLHEQILHKFFLPYVPLAMKLMPV